MPQNQGSQNGLAFLFPLNQTAKRGTINKSIHPFTRRHPRLRALGRERRPSTTASRAWQTRRKMDGVCVGGCVLCVRASPTFSGWLKGNRKEYNLQGPCMQVFVHIGMCHGTRVDRTLPPWAGGGLQEQTEGTSGGALLYFKFRGVIKGSKSELLGSLFPSWRPTSTIRWAVCCGMCSLSRASSWRFVLPCGSRESLQFSATLTGLWLEFVVCAITSAETKPQATPNTRVQPETWLGSWEAGRQSPSEPCHHEPQKWTASLWIPFKTAPSMIPQRTLRWILLRLPLDVFQP